MKVEPGSSPFWLRVLSSLGFAAVGFAVIPALAKSSGLPSWIASAVLVAVLIGGVLGFVALSRAREAALEAALEAAFSAIASRTAAQLEAGTLARVRVVIEPPTSLTVPLIGAGCAYYRASALVLIRGELDDYWVEDRVRWDGEIARARDSSGEMELDLRAGIDVIGKIAFHRNRTEPRGGDPLGVGLVGPYKVELQYLQAGDEVEVVGRVERGADGRYRIVPAERRLQVRVVAPQYADFWS